MSLFEFIQYKTYLSTKLSKRGQKAEFCEAVKCHPSFLSQVLKGAPNLSLEQGILASEFLEHSDDETAYFMTLLHYSRAGSKKLESFYLEKIQTIRTERQKISTLVKQDRDLLAAEKLTYYSSWTYAFAHVLLSIQSADQPAFLAEKMGLSRKQVDSLLRFLVKSGLATEKAGKYALTSKRIHLDTGSPTILQHHRNFRTRTLFELESNDPKNIHFSSILCLSRQDAQRIKSLILELISKQEEILKPSPEETARCLCIDYYEV